MNRTSKSPHTARLLVEKLEQRHLCAAVVWSVEAGGNGHTYEFISSQGIYWEAAKVAAESRGGHLATIEKVEENQFVAGLLSGKEAWLGATQGAGGWEWVTGEAWGYTNWQPGEPNNAGQVGEAFLGMWGPEGPSLGQWNDQGGANDPFVGQNIAGYVIESEGIDLTGRIDNDKLHKLVYPNQKYSVSLSISATEDIRPNTSTQLKIYLSKNSQSEISGSDRLLTTKTVRTPSESPLNLTYDFSIPSNQLSEGGEYYIKVQIDAQDRIKESEFGEKNNVLVSDRLHSLQRPFSTTSRASFFEQMVTIAKNNPQATVQSLTPSGVPLPGFIPSTIVDPGQRYTATWEGGLREDVYLDSKRIPTVGIGFNLNRSGAAAIVRAANLSFQLRELDIVTTFRLVRLGVPIGQTLTVQDLKKLANTGIKIPGMAAAATQWFANDYQQAAQQANGLVAGLEGNAKIVLTDLVFNTGLEKAREFARMRSALQSFVSSTGDDAKRALARAGAHLLDSAWAGQVGNRAKAQFRLLVSGAEDWL